MKMQTSVRRPRVVVVGGFLGSGKTSLIMRAVEVLEQRGARCAVILNDQGEELVDSRYARLRGVGSREVTGGCFCCRFSDFASALEELRAYNPEVIFAEPVGSCTDISATVLGPLREESDRYRLAPFTVLVDPARFAALVQNDADPNLAFLLQKQLQEADLVCISKADLYAGALTIPGFGARKLSAKTGQGIEAWLDEVLAGALPAGTKLLDIDYEQYARSEAALAWLNMSLTFDPVVPLSPSGVLGPFIDRLDAGLTAAGVSIVHLKLMDNCHTGWLKAALCANGDEPSVEGILDASPASRHDLLLNLRAVGTPALVRETVEEVLKCLDGNSDRVRMDCFSPAAPRPERRMIRTAGYPSA
jgi:hypothetical protein